ncbi:MAG: hypothetical protein ABR961_05565 [Thermoanaerobaculaceae bacterium]|jgi:hypothetical protein
MNTRLLKYARVAEVLDTTEASLREGLHSGRIPIPTVKVGVRGKRILESDLEDYIAANRQPGARARGARSPRKRGER